MKQKTFHRYLLPALAALAVTLCCALGLVKRPDKWLQDALFQRPNAPSEDIVVIGIDEESLAALGPYTGWDRGVFAAALEALAADETQRPAAVAIDVIFSGESSPEADARLAAAAEELGCVVTASVAEFGTSYAYDARGRVAEDSFAVLQYTEPYAALSAATVQGHINVMPDRDGVVRHALLYAEVPERGRVCSMAWETARLFALSRGEEGCALPQTDAHGNYYIPYTARPGMFYDASLIRLLRGELSPEVYAGRIVLIGPWAAGLQDAYFTPIDRGAAMYGVEVQANVIQSLLEGTQKREPGVWPQALVLFAVCLAALLFFLRHRPGVSGLVCAGLVFGAPALSLGLYAAGLVTHPLWIPLSVALLYVAALARHYVLAARERRRIRCTFERYVAPEIVSEVLKEGEAALSLGGKLCEIAVLFVDIRGFTTLSERLPPEDVVSILNRYLSMTSRCVAARRGTLDKFVGDATMAFWGAPLHQEDPVMLACLAAEDIVRGAKELSEELRRERGEELKVGVGVHFGPAVVGNMGSERRMDYTAIGDTVNTAARLEANAPGGTIYISRAVADALGERAVVRSLGGSVRLKGKAEGFEVLTLEALRGEEP